jgi:hypothetical protein
MMSSWRNSTPQHVQDDLDELVGVALDAAQAMVAKNGEFFPFGVTQNNEGFAIADGLDESLGDQPPSQAALVAALPRGRFRKKAEFGDLSAAAGSPQVWSP